MEGKWQAKTQKCSLVSAFLAVLVRLSVLEADKDEKLCVCVPLMYVTGCRLWQDHNNVWGVMHCYFLIWCKNVYH